MQSSPNHALMIAESLGGGDVGAAGRSKKERGLGRTNHGWIFGVIDPP